MVIDRIDRVILGTLQSDGRMTWQDLGRTVGLSANAAAERVRRLEAAGAITGWTVRLDPAALGRPIAARVAVRVDVRADRPAFESWLRSREEVVDAVHLSGRWDYELALAVASIPALDEFLTMVRDQWRIVETETRVVLREVAHRA